MAEEHLLLFGDRISETLAATRNLTHQSETSPILKSFLLDAADSIHVQAAKLDQEERKTFWDFDTVLGLAEAQKPQQEINDEVANILMYIIQLGELIIYAENDPNILGSGSSKPHILGFCVGLIPASIAALSSNSNDVYRYGIRILPAYFRLTLETKRRSRSIEEGCGSWATLVIGLPPKDQQVIVSEFNESQKVPQHRSAYIAVEGFGWATICGPPSVLSELFSHSATLSSAKKLRIPLGMAPHAAHLPPLNLDMILGDDAVYDTIIPPNVRILSTSTCQRYVARDLRALMCHMLLDNLQRTMKLEDTVAAMMLSLHGKSVVRLTSIGPTAYTPIVAGALAATKIECILSTRPRIIPMADKVQRPNAIAIVGMSGKFPGANDVHEFWEVLRTGQDMHRQIPKDRFDLDTFFDPNGTIKNSTSVPYGCFIDNPGYFDTSLFNVSPREAAAMDPIQRLLLMAAYEALQSAGYSPEGTRSTESKRIATYIGQAGDDWAHIGVSHGLDVFHVPGVLRAFAPGRLNYHFKLEGASYSLDSACSSSSTAVALACSALLARDADMALAGGASILSTPLGFSGLSKAGFLSHSGGCKTFRDDADGYCRGEGVGLVVLKRLEDAIHDNDKIRAVILGSARNHSAQASSITHPHSETQQRLYHQVLRKACVEAKEIGYIEMHGTATQAGDVAEMNSITTTFGLDRTPENPLFLGAVKANIGHGEAAAGIASLIKSVLIFEMEVVPPQSGLPNLINRSFPDLEKMQIQIPCETVAFAPDLAGHKKRKILLNNFDAAGGNTCLLLEEAPQRPQKLPDPRTHHVVALSGRTPASLTMNKQRLVQYLASHPETSLSDLAYTTTARRMHEVYRSAYAARSIEEVAQLISFDVTHETAPTRVSGNKSIVFLFTGQGSEYAGMGKELFYTSSRFRQKILSLLRICDSFEFPSFLDIITNTEINIREKQAIEVQLATICVELALADLWKSWGLTPSLVMGHSLGEYAALCISGVLSISDTLFLVGSRALIVQNHCVLGSYAMLAIACSATSIQELIDRNDLASCQIACQNAPMASVVSGKVIDLKALQALLQDTQKKTKYLEVPYGFHSQQLDPILEDFEETARKVHFGKPLIPMVSTLKTIVVNDIGVFTPQYLTRQLRDRVDFVGALQMCRWEGLVNGNTIFIEIGPDAICLPLVHANLPDLSLVTLASMRKSESIWKTMSTSIANVYPLKPTIAWPEFHKEYKDSLRLLELPTYAFDMKDYWKTYIAPVPVPGDLNVKDTTSFYTREISPTFSTTTLQSVQRESLEKDRICVIFESQTSEARLFDVIQGHKVSGVAVCPASVFVDMAFTAAKYIHMKVKPGTPAPAMTLRTMEIMHPLIVDAVDQRQRVRVTAVSDANFDCVSLSFASKDHDSIHEHGECKVFFSANQAWKEGWLRTSYLVKARITTILKSDKVKTVHQLKRPIIYKLFTNVVEYDEKYQGLEEVYLDSLVNDAVGLIKLQPTGSTGDFMYSPYWMDPIVHLAGFILNGHFNTPADIAYILSGIDSISILGEFSAGKTYTSYVGTQTMEITGHFVSDVYVFDDDTVVAVCTGVRFQKMKKGILSVILKNDTPQTLTTNGDAVQLRSSKLKPPMILLSNDSTSRDTPSMVNISEAFLAAVASETGFGMQDMEDTTAFADLGVDSLMGISILDVVKRATGVEIPATIFFDNHTVGDVLRNFGNSPAGSNTPPTTISPSVVDAPKMVFLGDSSESAESDTGRYASNVVLIQGRASSRESPLFLITDGAGSAIAYIQLPELLPERPVYALESPFLHCPTEFTCSIEEVAQTYIAAIKLIQGTGPYNIGGWSAGAVHAYEVSRQLLQQGEQIRCLLLIDMLVPKPDPTALAPTMDLIETAYQATQAKGNGMPLAPMPENIKQNFLGAVRALTAYSPIPMDPSCRPKKTTMLWARNGSFEVSSDAGAGRREHDFGPNGWDRLVGDIECHVVDGDHFSMLRRPHVAALREKLQRALSDA